MGHRYNPENEGKAKLKVGVEEVTFFFGGSALQRREFTGDCGSKSRHDMGWEYKIGRNETSY